MLGVDLDTDKILLKTRIIYQCVSNRLKDDWSQVERKSDTINFFFSSFQIKLTPLVEGEKSHLESKCSNGLFGACYTSMRYDASS